MSDPVKVVVALAGARKAIQLYPPAHPAYGEALDALRAALIENIGEQGLVLNWHQGRLYHESAVLPDDAPGVGSIAEAFEARRLESLEFSPAVTQDDLLVLIDVLALRPSPTLDIAVELESRGVTNVIASTLADETGEERMRRHRQRESDRALHDRIVMTMRHLPERLAGTGAAELGDTQALVTGVTERLLADPSAMLALATMRDTADHSLYHSLNVMIYTLVLGERLGLPEEGLESLGLSALLHDIGKTAFDASDPAQAVSMDMMHPEVGAKILQRVSMADPAPLLVAYEHHMHADGTGWPERPPDYVSHPYSRMVAVANRYEELTNPVDPSAALTPDRAIVQVLRESASILDPLFARLFANALGVFPVGCLVRLSDQSVGVVAQAGEHPLTPVVRVVYNDRGAEIEEPEDLDLATSEIRILEVVEPESLNVAVSDKL